MEVQGSLGRLIQGMSQQPPAVRLDGQVTYQLNTVPDVVDGVQTRPGTSNIKKLMDSLAPNSHFHHYRRGDDIEEYFIVTEPHQLPKVFDKNGNACSVSVEGDPASYINSAKPSTTIRMLTVADYTFIVNKEKVVKAKAERSPSVGDTALVFSAYGQYGTTYRILLGGVIAAEYITADGGESSHVGTIKTENITNHLFESLGRWSGIGAYTIGKDGTTIIIRRNDGGSIEVTTEDGAKGKDLVAIKNKVSSTDLLPARAPAGYKVEISPVGSKPESRYWMEAVLREGGNLVSWNECIAPGMLLGFDKATMPHVLVREDVVGGIAQFKLRQGEWKDRDTGDDTTNPFPSFLDQRIGGMFMVQNRLCFGNGEAVAMARTSRWFDFFRPTVLSALSTDPIDVFSDASEVYELADAVSLDGDTVVFSRTAQFLLPGDKALTKENTVLRPTTTFECSLNVSPVATGDAVMFAFTEGAYSGVREFYTDSTTDTKKAQPTTSHVNRLIEGNIRAMEASSNFNRLFVLTDKHLHRVYVYDWLWQGQERVQSAWHIWEFAEGSNVQAMFYSLEKVYILITRPDGKTYLEVMNMGDPLDGNDDQYRVDRGTSVEFRWVPANDRWESGVLPYVPQLDAVDAVIGAGGWDAYIGGSFLFSYDAQANILHTNFDLGDESGVVTCWVGETYPAEIEPTPVLIKDNQDRVSYLDVPTVGQIHINTDRAPTFGVDVTYVKTGRVRSVTLTNRIGGELTNIGGRVAPHEQSHRVPMRAKSTDVRFRIKVRSPHTFQLRDIEWEGSYNPRRRRM